VIKRLMDSMAVREWVSALGVGFKTIVEMGARVVAGMRAAGGFMPYVGRLMGRAGSAVGRFAGTTAFGRFMMGLTDVVGYAPMGVVHPAFQRMMTAGGTAAAGGRLAALGGRLLPFLAGGALASIPLLPLALTAAAGYGAYRVIRGTVVERQRATRARQLFQVRGSGNRVLSEAT